MISSKCSLISFSIFSTKRFRESSSTAGHLLTELPCLLCDRLCQSQSDFFFNSSSQNILDLHLTDLLHGFHLPYMIEVLTFLVAAELFQEV
jgi:hypothetical protein